jgi:hypothetical protein
LYPRAAAQARAGRASTLLRSGRAR